MDHCLRHRHRLYFRLQLLMHRTVNVKQASCPWPGPARHALSKEVSEAWGPRAEDECNAREARQHLTNSAMSVAAVALPVSGPDILKAMGVILGLLARAKGRDPHAAVLDRTSIS